MPGMAVKVSVRGLRNLEGLFDHYADEGLLRRRDEAIDRITAKIIRALREEAPRATNKQSGQKAYADAFYMRKTGSGQGRTVRIQIRNDTKVVDKLTGKKFSLNDIVIKGRKAIVPVNASTLHFFIGNDEIFAKYARSVAGNPFVTRALEKVDVRGELNAVAHSIAVDLGGK